LARDLLDQVRRVSGPAGPAEVRYDVAGQRLDLRRCDIDRLQTVGENLLAHLDYEELSMEATVLRVRESPGL